MENEGCLVTEYTVKILFADTDAGGMMYFGQACRFVEASVHNWFKQNSFNFVGKSNLFWVVRELNTLYSNQVAYDEDILLTTCLKHVGRYSIQFDVVFFGKDHVQKIVAKVRMVPIDIITKEPMPIPNSIYNLKIKLGEMQ